MSEENESTRDADSLWTAEQVATYLRVSKSLVYAKAASGELPSLSFLSRRRFDPVAIKAFALQSASSPAVTSNKLGKE